MRKWSRLSEAPMTMTTPLIIDWRPGGRGLHSFTLELNLSNSRTQS
jgi:hypothetical protein